MTEVSLNGLNTCYRQDGTGSRIFFLFNGAGCTIGTWGELADWLADLGQVVRFDARGAGQTELPEEPYTLEDLAEDAIALMDHLEIGAAILIGHAFGGRVAQIVTRDYPERAAALILCGTGGLYPPEMGQPPADASREEAWLYRFCGARFREEQPERAQHLLDEFLTMRPPREAGELRAKAIGATPAATYWGTTPESLPVLLVYGTEDRFGHADNAHDLAGRLQNSRLVFIEGAGHFAIREKPERMLVEITGFIKEHGV
jgi:3-oxoadipate enol-lactonase